MARSASSLPNERWSPSRPAKVKITQRTPGARSAAATAVAHHAKEKIATPSSANTTPARNAVRVRYSIARSLRATSHAAAIVPGGIPVRCSVMDGGELAVLRLIRPRIEQLARLVAHEPAAAHDRRLRRQGQPLGEVVGDEQ